MDVAQLHPWDLSPSEAIRLQRELSDRVTREGAPSRSDVRLIAGGDVAFDKRDGRACGAVLLLAYPSLEVVEQVTVEAPFSFPYVPGLLSFRETPVLARAFERLSRAPDLLFVDGHGYAHPRRFGFACHVGLLLDVPTIGVAKSRLLGVHDAPGRERGERADLTDGDDVIGTVLRTRRDVRPVYVSIGHRIGLDSAAEWTLECARGYRVPEPTRLADRAAGVAKRRMLELTLDAVIEQRAREAGRWEWVAEDGQVVFRHELEPMPTHYGCSTSLMNPADGELLDIIIVDEGGRARGEHLRVRVIGMLERADGDHKLLALPVDVDPDAPTTQRRLARAREESWAWYVRHERPVTRWTDEDAALAVIRSCEI